MKKITVGVLGATSYTGVELIKKLVFHESVQISFISSQTNAKQRFVSVFPEMLGIFDQELLAPEDCQNVDVDCVFSCLPHGVSAGLLIPFVNKGCKVIDFSADFRIKDLQTYTKWYKIEHPCPQFVNEAVYGLPEHYRDQIAKASLIANPGCYVTSVLLPILPLLKKHSEKIELVIADSKSGVSGAGRSLKLTSHFAEVNENFTAYSIGFTHRHAPEIDQEFTFAASKKVNFTFSPHLIPINRGILSTIYIKTDLSVQECHDIVSEYYKDEPFVRIRSSKDLPSVKNIAFTNYCDIAFTGGGEGRPVIAVSTLDNLLKGASGQALQNMNIMFALPETMGLLK